MILTEPVEHINNRQQERAAYQEPDPVESERADMAAIFLGKECRSPDERCQQDHQITSQLSAHGKNYS